MIQEGWRLLKHSTMTNDTKKQSEMMRRSKHCGFKKAYRLGKLCDADVAVIVRKNDQKSWPPSLEQIVSSIPFKFGTDMLIEIANCIPTAGKHASKIPRSSKSRVSYGEGGYKEEE